MGIQSDKPSLFLTPAQRRNRNSRWRNSRLGRKVQAVVDDLSRWWGLRFMPWLESIVLPFCQGVPMMEMVRHFTDRSLWQSARALSFSIVVAIPPLLIFLFTLIPFLPLEGLQEELLAQLSTIIPPSIYDTVAGTITDVMSHRHNSWLSIGFIVSVILATNGMNGMLQSFNSLDKEADNRPLVPRLLLCLGLVFLMFILIVVVLALMLGYKWAIGWLLGRNIIAPSKLTLVMFNFGRWVILIVITLLSLGILYYLAPAKKARMGFFSLGPMLSTLLLFAFTWLFQIYLNNFNRYNILYGSIGTLLIIMLWLNSICLVILVGYAVNLSVAKYKHEVALTPQQRRERRIREHNKQNGIRSKHPQRYHLRTEQEGYRQRHGSDIWFGAAGSVRYPRPGGTDGAQRS